MPLLLLSMLSVACVGWLWVAQAVAVSAAGNGSPWSLPFRHGSTLPVVRWTLKAALQVGLLGVVVLFPLTTGEAPGTYYQARLGWPGGGRVLTTLGLTVGVFSLYQGLNLLAGWVELTWRYSAKTTARKVARSFLTPVPLAIVEETVFRGLILEQMLQTFSGPWGGVVPAVVLSSALFSAVHFFRPQKRVWLPALGLFVLGVTLAVAYLVAGRNCWLPIAVHAGGVWVIQVLRPFVEYRRPGWLTGYPSYPICGVLGLLAMAVLTMLVVLTQGT